MGYEPGKKIKGRKIHSLVDTLGLPIRLVIHSAGIQDRDGAGLLFDKVKKRLPWLECVFADTGYNAQQTYEAAGANGLRLEVVRRNPNAVGFEVIKKTLGCRANLLLVRPEPTPRQGFREPRRHLAGLRHTGRHPVRHQAARALIGFWVRL